MKGLPVQGQPDRQESQACVCKSTRHCAGVSKPLALAPHLQAPPSVGSTLSLLFPAKVCNAGCATREVSQSALVRDESLCVP